MLEEKEIDNLSSKMDHPRCRNVFAQMQESDNMYSSEETLRKTPVVFTFNSNKGTFDNEITHGVDENKAYNSKFLRHLNSQRQGNYQNNDLLSFRKYDYKPESTADTITTITASSQSSFSFTSSLQNSNNNQLTTEESHHCDYYDELETSASLDSHLNYLASQDTISMRLKKEAIIKERDQNSRQRLPPVPRSTSPFHARLAETQTKSTLLRREMNKMKLENGVGSKPPFYTTIAKANSFSDSNSSLSSVSMFPEEKKTRKKKIPSSLHSRLAVSQTISSSLRLQQQRHENAPIFERPSDTRKPFYTMVVKPKQSKGAKKKTRDEYLMESSIKHARQSNYLENRRYPSTGNLRSSTLRITNHPFSEQRKRSGKRVVNTSLYDRLAYTGTAASLQRNRTSVHYKEEHRTLHESCKNALMRDFKGSTFVPVARGRVTKSVIGSVVNCG